MYNFIYKNIPGPGSYIDLDTSAFLKPKKEVKKGCCLDLHGGLSSSLQKQHPALQNTKFVLFSLFEVPFYTSWIRLR